jgi:AcrR family transcriptional regulator
MEALMPKVTNAYLKARRQEIMDAAIACFARKGFHRTTVDDICEEAGLSPGAVYRYFSSKDDIIVATVEESVVRSAHFFQALAVEEDIFPVLEHMLEEHFQRLEQPERNTYYKVRMQLWAEAAQNPGVKERLQLIRHEAVQQYAAAIKKGQKSGYINPDLDAQAVSVAIMASLDGFVIHWLADPEMNIWHYKDVLVAMLRGLQGGGQISD